jgi:hypothetical protein
MPRVQDAIPGNPQRAWQRRANPVLINPLHLAPESTIYRAAISNAGHHTIRGIFFEVPYRPPINAAAFCTTNIVTTTARTMTTCLSCLASTLQFNPSFDESLIERIRSAMASRHWDKYSAKESCPRAKSAHVTGGMALLISFVPPFEGADQFAVSNLRFN